MPKSIDNSYRKESLLDWERKTLKGEMFNFDLTKKLTWIMMGSLFIVIITVSFVGPFLPPRYNLINWRTPVSLEDYFFHVKKYLICGLCLIVFAVIIFILSNLRRKFDLRQGIKRTANFKIIFIIKLIGLKILVLNDLHFYFIKSGQEYFKTVHENSILTIKRTYTFKVFYSYIRDENKFLKETNI